MVEPVQLGDSVWSDTDIQGDNLTMLNSWGLQSV